MWDTPLLATVRLSHLSRHLATMQRPLLPLFMQLPGRVLWQLEVVQLHQVRPHQRRLRRPLSRPHRAQSHLQDLNRQDHIYCQQRHWRRHSQR